ncbi:MAG: hypothetical protein OSJ56_10005 [Prevotella sp.]|nr:hypothetical protein [Prevotella sp.]
MNDQYVIDLEGLTVYEGENLLEEIDRKLGALRSEKYKVLKNAVNATAKKANADLIAKAQAEYTAKKAPLNKATTKKNATIAKPEATITVKGGMLEIRSFKTTVPKSGAKAKILQSGNLKTIQSQKGSRAKAFLTTFQSGHKAIVQRQDGQQYRVGDAIQRRKNKWGKNADMTRIKELMSVSYPIMVGGTKVLKKIAPGILADLKKNIQIEIRKVLGK